MARVAKGFRYLHIAFGALQALNNALNYLVDILHAFQLTAQSRFSGFLTIVKRLAISGR
jgi:hypothetical protein